MITHTPKWGTSLEQAAGEAICLSAKENEAVLLQFNNKEIVVNHFSCIEGIINEYYEEDKQEDLSKMEDSPVDASQCLLEELAPLFASPWSFSTKDECVINGEWNEDFNDYEIKVPPQLRDSIIKMQHYMYYQYKELQKHKKAIADIERKFTSCGANPAEL